MTIKNLNSRLLIKQIRKHFGSLENVPEEVMSFIQSVNQSYDHFESDRLLIERNMELSSHELMESNERLTEELLIQKKALNKLKESLITLGVKDLEEFNNDDILQVTQYLENEIKKRQIAEIALSDSERNYVQLVETAGDIIYRVNKEGYFTYVNPVGYHLSGFSEEEVSTMRYIDIVRDDFKKRVGLYYISQVQKKRPSSYLEFPMRKKGGSEVWIGQNVQLLIENGEYVGIQAVARDITELKRTRDELKKAKRIAEASSKAKKEFLANMSHEIRTPMNAIVGMVRLLKETELKETQKKYLEAISTSSDNLIILINDILDISKIESGKLNLESVGFSISGVVEAIVYSQKVIAEEKGIELTFSVEQNCNGIIKGDPYRLGQILTNLVSNGIKFTTKGTVHIEISRLADSNSKELIQLRVIDSGIGIEEGKLNSIFESFNQADSSITREFGGTGLGLAITKHLVQMMGGTLRVESSFGNGSTFIVQIPFLEGEINEVNPNVENEIESYSLKGIKVFLVEDNRINRLLIFSILKKWEIEFEWAENGKEATEKLKKDSDFDLILMDMQMPVMDGLEATKIIRKELKITLPIIALTANALQEHVEKCLESGMNDVVTKPFEPSVLYKKIITLFLALGHKSIEK